MVAVVRGTDDEDDRGNGLCPKVWPGPALQPDGERQIVGIALMKTATVVYAFR